MYHEVISTILEEGKVAHPKNPHNPQGHNTLEIHPAVIEVSNPLNRLVTAVGRPVNVAFALAEVLWILQGREDVEMLKFYNRQIARYSDDGTTFNAAYGARLRNAHGYDQIGDVISILAREPDSRQAVLCFWHKNDRGWDADGGQRIIRKDRACNLMSHLMIRDGCLDWMQMIRSNDALWGVPYNWMQFSHLQEWIATSLGVPVGTYIHVADSLHIYDYHFEEAGNIRRFDLYEHLMQSHKPMSAVGEEVLEQLAKAEEQLRNGNLHTKIDPYWDDVLQVLEAHRFYREELNETAYDILLDGDAIYGAAQIRFYYHQRWHQHPAIVKRISEEWPEQVANWIMTTYRPSAKSE